MQPVLEPARRPAWRRTATVLMGASALLHALLFVLVDLRDADAFMRADRASIRLQSIQQLLDGLGRGVPFGELIGKLDLFFDYGVHAAFYSIGGPPVVILFQCLLACLAVGGVSWIAHTVFEGRTGPTVAATVLYMVLPQTIAFPHQLVTEAIANPLLILATATFFAWWRGAGRGRGLAVLSGVLFALAALVRPALILIPCVLIAAVYLGGGRDERRPSRGPWITAAAFAAVLIAWSGVLFALTGSPRTRESSQDLGTNFSMSVAAVLLNQGQVPEGVEPLSIVPERISASDYLGYVWRYPMGFTTLYLNNVLVVAADSGIGRLYVDLLGLGVEGRKALQDRVTGWRPLLTNHGPVAMLKHGLKVAPGPILAGVTGALLFLAINLGLLLAYLRILRAALAGSSFSADTTSRGLIVFLALLPPYVLLTSQVVAYAASRHRSQVEFAWVVLAVWGAAAFLGGRASSQQR